MCAYARTSRDWRRRSLGQNFLLPERGAELVAEAELRAGELVVEIGAGRGALTLALAAHDVELVALELDPHWVQRLRAELRQRAAAARASVIQADALEFRLPTRPFRAIGNLPFGRTTDILHRLFDDPTLPLERADLIVQWEVARKRAATPPDTLLSTSWAPWWEFRLGRRIPARDFRPVPAIDAAVLVATRRNPPILPPSLGRDFADFLRARWPFDKQR